jgi:protein kinase A
MFSSSSSKQKKNVENDGADDTNLNLDLDKDFSLKNTLFGSNFSVNDLTFFETIGLSSSSRVRLVKSQDKKYYSLKMMKKSVVIKLKQIKHVSSEIYILSRLTFVFAPELHAVFQDENSLYLLSEYVSGGELFSHLRRQESFEPLVYQFYAVEISCK